MFWDDDLTLRIRLAEGLSGELTLVDIVDDLEEHPRQFRHPLLLLLRNAGIFGLLGIAFVGGVAVVAGDSAATFLHFEVLAPVGHGRTVKFITAVIGIWSSRAPKLMGAFKIEKADRSCNF